MPIGSCILCLYRQSAHEKDGGFDHAEKRIHRLCKALRLCQSGKRPKSMIDFKDKTIDARIGAKAGGELCSMPDLREMGLRPPVDPSTQD